jgi:serine/threonine-protein kinase
VSPESSALLRLAESVADGAPVDWGAEETRADSDERDVVRQLRVVSELARAHRSLPPHPPAVVPHRAPTPGDTGAPLGYWGPLALLERLGGGTFGEVYHAWDRALERNVALKLLRSEWLDNPKISRLTQEGRHLARVRHPNVVTVHGVAMEDGRVGLWMELIRGATLEHLLLTRGTFSAREAALIGIELCRGLAAIHAAGLVHRDVKAQNVMREDGGRIVLMDLGTGSEMRIKQRSDAGGLAGTPLYLAPEIFAGATADPSSDVYSLGVLLYRLVTGSYPVKGGSIEQLRAAHGAGDRQLLRDARPDLPVEFVRIVDRATATEPEQRYRTAGALEADLLQSLEGPAARPAATAPPADERRGGRLTRLAAGLALAGALAAAALAVVLWPALRDRWSPGAAVPAIRSIAILPLVNLSGDPAHDSFVDGLTDELIGTFGQLVGIDVTSRTSVMQFKGDKRPLPDIARQLKVDAVLEGTIRMMPGGADGDDQRRVRLNARLILAGTDTQLWNRTVERVLTNVLSLQSELAELVASEMHLPTRRSTLQVIGSPVAAAQEAYLEGRSNLVNSARENLVKARAALERATALDPAFARAHGALAVCYLWLGSVGALPNPQVESLATASADRAIQLDPDLPEAHLALADLQFFYRWNWSAAEASYQRALSLNPSYTFARRNYAWYLAARGRQNQAVQEARTAETLDPLTADARAAVAMMLFFDRQYDAAIDQMQKALALAPDLAQEHNGLGRAYAAKGAIADAIRELEHAVRLSGGAPAYVMELARIHAVAGDPATARRLVAELEATAKVSNVEIPPVMHAWVETALGDSDRALQLLDQGSRAAGPSMLWINVDPRFDAVRDDPRFAAIVGRLGIPRQ